MDRRYRIACFGILLSVFLFFPVFPVFPGEVLVDGKTGLCKGQRIYVPAYSHIYSGNRERPFLLTVTLSIRNIDPAHEMVIVLADYYETQGELLKRYVDKPLTLDPLESVRYVVPEKDESGGSGANFIVEWKAEQPVNPPIVESIMIGTKAQQGISFTSRGRPLIVPETASP